MTDYDLKALEDKLLVSPFDADLRLCYAEALQNADDLDAAVRQYESLQSAAPESIAASMGLAACELARGNNKEALEHYVRARKLDGFQPHADLEQLAAKAQKQAPKLSIVSSEKSNVLAFAAPRESIGFDDVAGMHDLKKILRLQIIEPFRNPGLFSRFGKKAGGGVLLFGPPGCGKTLMARAIAGECNANFHSIGISDVLNMWIGESERNLAEIFDEARTDKPCVLFFDELDALAYSRSKTSSSAARTVVNEFLAQLDGFEKNNDGVLILAATNMPWDVDQAMKRPGRFSRQVFVPPPDEDARKAMFDMKLEDIPTDAIDCSALASKTQFYSGADIDGVVDQARDIVLSLIHI